jgi:alkanesulfonate monooxygenase SsuD/methylene tetrahydromethanopterin reductase-like flavin-dependent oxidoreductase (luciferase family)
MPVGSFISTGRSLPEAVERVQLAEQLGYASAYVTHINGRDGLQVCMAYAQRTERIRVGTGVVPIYTRTPATMAQEAATIADASGGRMMLGIGVSHRPVVEAWHGQSIDKPVTEMREYTAIVRAILDGEPPPPGDKWTSHFQLGGLGPFPDLPIGVAALSPNMLRLAGEIGDAVILWLCNPNYIRDVVVPCVREGREKAGKTMDGFDVIAAVPSAATDDVAGAYAAMRRDLLPYFGLPFYRAMLERSGFAADIAAYDAVAGDPAAMGAAISDDFLATLTAIGDEGAVRAGIQRYLDAGATSPCIGPIAKTDFNATLQAGAPGA